MTLAGTAAVVLAAGASTRLGQPKQLIEIAGEALLARSIRTAREAGCSPVVVVLGFEAEKIADEISTRRAWGDAVVVINFEWEEGMASSIRAGVAAVHAALGDDDLNGGFDGVVLMTCDQPTVTAEHLRALMASGAVTASAYAGRHGVPAYFPAASFPALLELTGDAGARILLRDASAIDLPRGELDIDTPADLAILRSQDF